jgi:hypothetical protein
MPRRNAAFEVEEIEQLALIDRLPTHHDSPPPLKASTKRNHDSPIITSDFFNSIDPLRRWRSPVLAAGYWGSPAATVAPMLQGQAMPGLS